MGITHTFVAPQQLFAIHGHLGSEFFRALDFLTSKLTEMPREKRGASPREYAELREAKSLISYMRYPDATESVRTAELAWALKLITDEYRADGHHEWAGLFEQAANLLGIDLLRDHPMPADLDRRISNELLMISRPLADRQLTSA